MKNFLDSFVDTYFHMVLSYSAKIVLSIFILIIIIECSKYSHKLTNYLFRKFKDKMEEAKIIINAIIKILIWALGLSLIFNLLGLGNIVSHIIAGAGILGIIAGFAFKDIASNGFAGFLIKIEKPFAIGDWVEIEGHIGTVEDINLITTGIKTIQGQMAYIPNQCIFSGSFTNYSTFGMYRIIIQFGISYGDDLGHVEEVALRTVRSLPIIEKPEDVDFYFLSIGGSTYNFDIRYWIKYTSRTDMLKATNMGIQALKKAFEKENICVAYNVMTLDFSGKGGKNLDETSLRIKTED